MMELCAGRVAPIRADVSLQSDVRLHKRCMNIIMSYQPTWLRLGLEATFDEELVSCEKARLVQPPWTPSTHGLFDFHFSSKVIPIVIPV